MFRIGNSAVLIAIAAAALFGSGGCSEKAASSGGPPPASEPDQAPVIGVVVPFGEYTAVNVWVDDARMQEAPTRSVARFYQMDKADPPARQAELVKQAAADGCSALIVLPSDPAQLVTAIADVRKDGLPVVALDQPIGSTDGLPPATLVTFQDEAASAKKLVDAAIADAKEAGYPADGPAVLLAHDFPDARAKARRKATKDALKQAGIRVLPEVNFVGYKTDAANALKVAFKIYDGVAMVLCDDDFAIRGATETRHLLDHKQQRFVISGFITDPELVELSNYNIVSGMVDRKIHEPMKIAYKTALALSRGETVAPEIRTPAPFYRKTGPEVEGFFPPYVGNPDLILGKQGDAAEKSKSGGRMTKPPGGMTPPAR